MMQESVQDEYSLALGKEVPIASIDKELHLLWEADKASTNASLINLAVYSEADGAIIRNSEVVQAITREHACRALLIGIDREASEASIRAWVTAHCHLSQGRKSVCCEQIAFQLTGKATGRLRNTVFAHLNSDLPLVFWWQGELSPIFGERLYSLIDRFIFDSSDWKSPLESFRCIEQVMEEVETLQPMDIEWTRSYHIRYAIAGLFDDPLAMRAAERMNRVRIVAHPKHRVAALQLLAWMAACTGWQRSMDLGLMASSPDDHYYFESREGVDVTAVIELHPEGPPIRLIEVSCADCLVSVSREPGSAYLQQKLDAEGHVIDRCTPAGSEDASELVMNQLSMGGKNSLYRMMMPVFLDLLGGEPELPSTMSVR